MNKLTYEERVTRKAQERLEGLEERYKAHQQGRTMARELIGQMIVLRAVLL